MLSFTRNDGVLCPGWWSNPKQLARRWTGTMCSCVLGKNAGLTNVLCWRGFDIDSLNYASLDYICSGKLFSGPFTKTNRGGKCWQAGKTTKVPQWGRLSQNHYCVHWAWTAQIKEEKIKGRRREGKMQMGYYFSFCIPSNCNHRQMSESVTASAELLLRAQNLCLKIIRHSVCCCLL